MPLPILSIKGRAIFLLRIKKYWEDAIHKGSVNKIISKKQNLYEKRDIQLLHIFIEGQKLHTDWRQSKEVIDYNLHFEFLLSEGKRVYLEEAIYPIRAVFNEKDTPTLQQIIHYSLTENKKEMRLFEKIKNEPINQRFTYNRREAVRYAELWWNSYNPQYRNFPVNCTNYVSQCLFAGGAPMWGAPNRSQGWWYSDKNNGWSFSWSVAHSFMWYLAGSTQGLQAIQKERASELSLGDVICYDFNGDNRWDHTTIVTSKDASGEPLVNAHTDFSRHRYWSYEDSLAWTEDCQYKFFHIIES